jgi:GLPGLI family protein
MKIFFFLMLILGNNVHSQVKTLSVDYGLTIGDDSVYQENGDMKEHYNLAIENAKYLSFNLFITEKETEFTLKKLLDNLNNGITFSKMFSGYNSDIYIDNLDNISYETRDDILGKYVLKKPIVNIGWELFSETKVIQGLICYKATAKEVLINPVKSFTFQITAWFCPEIPISSGPLGFGGLPGLILELHRRNVVFGATKIDLNPASKKIRVPEMVNAITIEELKKRREDFLNSKL